MYLFSQCMRCMVPGPLSLVLRLTMLLSIPLMIGGVIIVARTTKKGQTRDRAVIATVPVSLILFLFVPLILSSDLPGPYSPLVLHAGPFKWPEGCADRNYKEGDEISIACHNYRNVVPPKLLLDHGFPGLIERTEHDYFRVGSDAINFRCNYFTEKCTVRHAEHNVFQ
jgi:hypothetical protein